MKETLAQQLSEIPFGEMLVSMGRGVAEAQFELDKMSSLVALAMSGKYQVEINEAGTLGLVERDNCVLFAGEALSLLELGFTPTFYQFVDTILEIKVSVSMTEEQSITETKSQTET